ncbi:MAG: nuclear transport factor 2 family protein, partial [Flavobacteriaceae bacterium]|nr:nuclear transport factor 2 family protein [Flavobacteriaceae bacterium]
MRNYLLGFFLVVSLIFVACQQPTEKTEAETPDYATFNKKVETIRAYIKAYSDEDFDAQVSMLSDTLTWSPPVFNGNKSLGKKEYSDHIKEVHEAYENLTYTEGIVLADNTLINGMFSGSVFPKDMATSTPNNVRVYGTWTATHTETGKEVAAKWYMIIGVNADGKIT